MSAPTGTPSPAAGGRNYYQGALTGNLVTIELGGSIIGLVQALQAQEDFGLQPVSGVGQVTPVEHAPSIARFNLSCETIFISTKAALQMANGVIVPYPDTVTPPRILASGPSGKVTTLEGAGIIPSTATDILRGAVFDIVVYRLSDYKGAGGSGYVRKYSDCSYAGGSISFQKHQIVMQNATFMALDYDGAYLGNGKSDTITYLTATS
jgi:hypothetical protein